MKDLINRIKLYFLLRKVKKTMQPANEGKKLVYTDKYNNKWYIMQNQANLHATRSLAAWSFTKDSEFGIGRDKLKKALDMIETELNNEKAVDRVNIGNITGVLKAGLELYAEPQILLNLASCYTFLNDEKEELKDYAQEQKKAIWTSDNDCRSFFLQFALQYTHRYSESQKLNVQEYLEKTKAIRDQISHVLSR